MAKGYCKVFYDQLHCPTGFEFWNGGVIVVDQPRLLFLKDTDGDDRADLVVHLLDGWASDDTHHTASAFEWSHGGKLHMLEGIATSTTLETPWGPHRSQGVGGAYVMDPRTLKIRQFALPGHRTCCATSSTIGDRALWVTARRQIRRGTRRSQWRSLVDALVEFCLQQRRHASSFGERIPCDSKLPRQCSGAVYVCV